MNARAIRAVIVKDLTVIRQSKAVLLPIIIVPAVMLVLIPILASLAPSLINLPGMGNVQEGMSNLQALFERMPEAMQRTMAPYAPEQRVLVLMIVYLFAPLYLIVPTMVASVIAADSFAGEKERKTLEALLHTPITSYELFVAKLLVGWLPAVAVAWLGFALYALVANLAGWPVMGRVFFPTPLWWALAAWVAPAVAALSLSATVLVSARVKTFQEAMQLGGVIVLPLVALVVSQATGVLYLSLGFALALGLALWLLAAALLALGARTFRRGELIAQL